MRTLRPDLHRTQCGPALRAVQGPLGPMCMGPRGTQQQRVVQVAAWDPNRFLTDEDKKQFSVEQQRFLARKRRYRAGEGPALPEECTCSKCSGSGMVVCHECNGSGVNERDMEEIMKNELENIVVANNGVVNVVWFFQKGGPCWYCRGDPNCPCRSCEGTGMANFRSSQYSGD